MPLPSRMHVWGSFNVQNSMQEFSTRFRKTWASHQKWAPYSHIANRSLWLANHANSNNRHLYMWQPTKVNHARKHTKHWKTTAWRTEQPTALWRLWTSVQRTRTHNRFTSQWQNNLPLLWLLLPISNAWWWVMERTGKELACINGFVGFCCWQCWLTYNGLSLRKLVEGDEWWFVKVAPITANPILSFGQHFSTKELENSHSLTYIYYCVTKLQAPRYGCLGKAHLLICTSHFGENNRFAYLSFALSISHLYVSDFTVRIRCRLTFADFDMNEPSTESERLTHSNDPHVIPLSNNPKLASSTPIYAQTPYDVSGRKPECMMIKE